MAVDRLGFVGFSIDHLAVEFQPPNRQFAGIPKGDGDRVEGPCVPVIRVTGQDPLASASGARITIIKASWAAFDMQQII